MENLVAADGYVSFFLHSRPEVSEYEAEELVRSALRRAGLAQWRAMEIELFSAGGGTLVIARPHALKAVHIADYALPFFYGLFTQ